MSSLYITHIMVKELVYMVLVVGSQTVSGQVNTAEAPSAPLLTAAFPQQQKMLWQNIMFLCLPISSLQSLCPALPVTSSNPGHSWKYEASLWVQSFWECCTIEVLNHRSSSSSGQVQVSSDSDQSTVDQTDADLHQNDQVTVQCVSLQSRLKSL